MSSGFAAERTVVCAAAKNTKSLAARVSGYGAGSQPIPRANAVWRTNGHVLVSDVAARDVQAATSPASQIARAGRKSWRFAGDGSGARGKAGVAKAKSFEGFPRRKRSPELQAATFRIASLEWNGKHKATA